MTYEVNAAPVYVTSEMNFAAPPLKKQKKKRNRSPERQNLNQITQF